jgi:hypothetical protein
MSAAVTELSEDAVKDALVRALREAERGGWYWTTHLDDVPAEPGYYGIQDGLAGLGGGVTRNMRDALRVRVNSQTIRLPIFSWKPDTDGSATSWLERE